MMYLKDKGDVWSSFSEDMTEVVFEDGTRKPFDSTCIKITRGKMSGKDLSEIDDVGYLNWMVKSAVEKGDVFTEKCARMRLLELS